jgi:hypothetical protein
MSDNKDRVYAPGMNWKQPNESAPEFIKAKVGIKVFEEDGKEGEFIKFLKDNAKKDGSQDGRYYFELDTWEPKPQVEEDAPF